MLKLYRGVKKWLQIMTNSVWWLLGCSLSYSKYTSLHIYIYM